jgi:hypothetical protein
MTSLPIRLKEAAHDGMEVGMTELARIASQNARWQADGTDNGKWIVTGTARESLTGYVDGDTPQYPSFDITDKYKNRHLSPAAQYDAVNGMPTSIIGVLTMSEQHSDSLQKYERSGTSTMTGGENITVEALRNNKDWLWSLIALIVKSELH